MTGFEWWPILFVMACIVDIMYIFWMRAANSTRAWRAGLFSLVLYAIGIFGTVEVVENRESSIPLLAGYFAGSVMGVKISNRLDEKGKDKK